MHALRGRVRGHLGEMLGEQCRDLGAGQVVDDDAQTAALDLGGAVLGVVGHHSIMAARSATLALPPGSDSPGPT
ncbi:MULTISPECIES: hypothetical protein [Nocardia]|uniref:Uncharacterized protein n=1 Tax=Nocardia implantans TaxID=3108168 RepID=A0ABU6AZS1_9NOCA|nr:MULTISPECIES: hypothetical protein [unclassified Nocardia]MEA3530884.1 hypothetical protein [Nocardia sp. CDC192]MEB3512986.1 hypothetical protein [Nocardia sp. CDC186]